MSFITLKWEIVGVSAIDCTWHRCRPAIAEPLVPSTCNVRRSSRRTRVAHELKMVPKEAELEPESHDAPELAAPRQRGKLLQPGKMDLVLDHAVLHAAPARLLQQGEP